MMGLELVIPLAKIVGLVGSISTDAARVTKFNMDVEDFVCLR
jgi:hypothetical protein